MSPALAAEPSKPFAGVRAPKRLLPEAAERKLTERQREILDELEAAIVEDGFAGLTMAQLAARMNCSLRTLYGLAPSKDALQLMVMDRRLHRIGRAAMTAVAPDLDALSALRAYLQATNLAIGPTTETFARSFDAVPGADRLMNQHGNYVIAVTRTLLDRAIEAGQIQPVDTGALALVLGGLGGFFARPQVIPLIAGSPQHTADAILEILIRGLEAR
ncbi:MAG: TetR/AcrR family transcriptional regulator [Myxococcota bacterium]